MSTPLELLEKARALITDINHWGTAAYAGETKHPKTHEIEIVLPANSLRATCFCATGALLAADNASQHDLERSEPFYQAVLALSRASGQRTLWVNDYRGHAAVLEMYDAAIASLKDPAS